MTNKSLYKGYSFENFSYNKSIKVYDIELIKKDLYNNIFTRRGGRVKMFKYGTRIPDLVFEMLDDPILDAIESDLITVVSNEPRVELKDIKIVPLYDKNTVIASLLLFYVELNFTERFDISIDFET